MEHGKDRNTFSIVIDSEMDHVLKGIQQGRSDIIVSLRNCLGILSDVMNRFANVVSKLFA